MAMVEVKQHAPYQAVIESPLPGHPCIGIRVAQGSLTAVELLGPSCHPCLSKEEGVAEVAAWFRHYFSRTPHMPPPPLKPQGTPFQQRVWQRLLQIPSGAVVRYGELAQELGSSARAVAGACRANPIPLIIPCHRVIAATGPGGYMGQSGGEALAIKRWLLQHEGHV
jgi:methylated-DNA-[protein]-cysteine S-methyltransferase